jgi:exonuclease III
MANLANKQYLLTSISWNIDGLVRKLQADDVRELLGKYDFISLQETHTSVNNIYNVCVDLDGYIPILKHSTKQNRRGGRGSGGLLFLYKQSLQNSVTAIPTDNPYTPWVKVRGKPMGWDKDLYICSLYIPPADSPYFHDQFTDLENEIAQFGHLGNVLMMGDFNARTADNGRFLHDFIPGDNDKFLSLPVDYIADSNLKSRQSLDTAINSHGRKLVEMLIATQIRILNGRTPGDYTGKLTCHTKQGSSAVDYMMLQEHFIENVVCLNVGKPTQHSIHCSVSLVLKCAFSNEQSKLKLRPNVRKCKLDNANVHIYQNELLSDHSLAQLQTVTVNDDAIDQTVIDKMTATIASTVHAAAVKATKTNPRPADSSLKRKQRQSYTYTSTRKEEQFNSVTSLMGKHPTDQRIRSQYFSAKQKLRKTSKRKQKDMQQDIYDKLDSLHDENPKSYWELVNTLMQKENSSHYIPDDVAAKIHEHFKTIGSNDTSKYSDPSDKQLLDELKKRESQSTANDFLDCHITYKEISTAINHLKLNKACGPDHVTNEMLRYGLIPLFPSV